ncbi:hypothetical protein [Amycolatopsis anabasis]|uniref:hypothetical protein n=1 Tax=Amycolatopsis anabasis TaxID=1840409 RepID=UPI00131C6C9A|nr:hypothetical protein [Amycolatopsis anabasis]
MIPTRKAFSSLAVAGAAAAALLATAPTASAGQPAELRLDRTTVAYGEALHVLARCDEGETLNHVGSEAFVPTGDDGPYEGNGGVVKFTRFSDAGAEGDTTIRNDIAPGTYHVGLRCGGGNAGGSEITVVAAR